MTPEAVAAAFGSTVLPVLAVAAVGVALGRATDVDVDSLNTVALYVLLPALIFHSVVTTSLAAETALSLVAAVVAFTLLMILVGGALGRALEESGATLSALVLAGAFPNVGNFGIPVATFAFGDVGRSVAVLFVAAQNVLSNTLGVYLASRGGGRDWRDALRSVFELPLIYALAAGGLVRLLDPGLRTGGTALRTVALLGDAAIPMFLLVLGIQLARTDAGAAIGRTAPAVALKLLVAPAVGAAVALAVAFRDPTVTEAFVLLSAAPVAVTPLLLLVEFDETGDGAGAGVTGPGYMSTAILTTLLASVPVVTVLVAVTR